MLRRGKNLPGRCVGNFSLIKRQNKLFRLTWQMRNETGGSDTGGNREGSPFCSQITWSRNPNFWNEDQIRGKLVIGINGGCIELMVSRTGSDLTLHLLRHRYRHRHRRFRLGCRLVLSLPFLPCKIHQNKTTIKNFAFLSN